MIFFRLLSSAMFSLSVGLSASAQVAPQTAPQQPPKTTPAKPSPPVIKNRFGLIEGWKGEASASGSKTTGNTETEDVGLGLKLANTEGRWKHKFKGGC